MSKIIKILLLGLVVCCRTAFSADSTINFSIVPDDLKRTSSDMHFFVQPGLHFNLEAPNKAEALIDGKWREAVKIEIKGTKLLAQWAKTFDPCDGLRAELYICDDKNTFCVPRSMSFDCKGGSAPWKSGPPKVISTSKPTEARFIINKADEALELAKVEHKPLLIDFFGIWCPPCNELDETVFNSKEFDKIQTQFVLLKLDADSPSSWKLKSKFKIRGYPTVVFTNETADEISRIVGYRSKKEFVALMEVALNNKENSMAAKTLKAKTSAAASYELGLLYLERADYYLAHYYLLQSSRHWSLPDIRRNKLMSAQLGVQSKGSSTEDRKAYEQLLLKALEWYPRQIEVFDRTDSLVAVAEELEDKENSKKAYETEVETANWYLDHPKALHGTDIVRGDLYETLGSAYEALDDKQKSLDAYADGAKEYLREIKKANLDENSERGYNLERIYCLWKSGQVDPAQKYYEKFEQEFPREFTFYYQHAKLLKELKLYKEAEEKAQLAFNFSYGDNKLRAASLLAEIYQNDNKKSKALEVLNKVTEHADLPEDKSIRTHIYFNKLVTLKKKIEKS
jgi:thioredoxin-like negative regulator of GroEL